MSEESKADLEEEKILQIQISRLEEKRSEQSSQYDISTKSEIQLANSIIILAIGFLILGIGFLILRIIVHELFIIGGIILLFGFTLLLRNDDKKRAQLSENRILIRDRKFLLRGIIAHNMNIIKKEKRISALKGLAKRHEKLLELDEAAETYKELGMDDDVIRIRKLKSEQGAVKVSQKVVQGDEVTKTEIKDSVLNRSNIGAGSSKMQELKDLTEMKEKGLIDDDEFKQMKKEILGK